MSIRSVAQMAGVAPSTVSLVVNKPSQVAEATREAVLKAMRTLDYVPKARGRPRKGVDEPVGTNRSYRVALIVSGAPSAVFQAPVYMNVVNGVESGLDKQGVTMVLRRAPSALLRPLLPTRVDGLLLLGDPDNSAVLQELTKLPCVQIMGRIKDDCKWDHVSYDNNKIGKLGAEYLYARGHRHCAFIGEDSSLPGVGEVRRSIFKQKFESLGGTARTLVKRSLYLKSYGVQRVHRVALASMLTELLRLKPRPTGVFVEADLLTSVLYSLLYEMNLRPGRDLEIVSCNNEQLLLQGLHPRPATIDIHAEDVGRRAVEQLFWRIEHRTDPRVTLELQPVLIPGESLEK